MPKPQKRDNTYYLDRLKRDHPKIHADYLAGKFSSPLQAFEVAGLKKRRSRLQELKSAWQKATVAERDDFLAWAGVGPSSTSKAVAGRPIEIGGRLEPWAKARIEHIMTTRGIKMGKVLDELGFGRLNPSLGAALSQASRIKDATMLTALEKWLSANASV